MALSMYITAIDRTTEKDNGHFRRVSLAINESHPDTLQLLGGLSHNTEIAFDKENAQKLIDWLSRIV